MSGQERHFYEFGPFRLDPAEQTLLREGRPVALAPKDFELLLALVRRCGRLAVKDELLQEVWPEEFVEEANLSRHVYALRRALGEDEAGRAYIETVPKRGYRFAAVVREVTNGEAEAVVETLTRTRIVAEEEISIEEPGRPDAIGEARAALPRPNIERGRKVGRRAWFAALAAALAVGAAALLLVRHYRRAQPLTERDTVMLADFENRTGDEVFDETLKQALAVQLEQSPFLSIYPDQRVRETLRFMGRAPEERVTRELAREICERQGLKALLTGSITSLGSHYVITLEALNGLNGDSLARAQVEAESKERVLGALGEAASKLRGGLGESLASVQKFDAPPEQATTSSLEALKAFSLGNAERNRGRQLEAITFYKRAIEIDPNFALAYARLAITLRNTYQPELAAQASQRAFELRERVSERERFYISYTYYASVTYEIDKATEELELWARTYPNDATPHNNLSSQYVRIGQFEKTVEEARESIRLNPNAPQAYSTLGTGLASLNHFDEAQAVYEEALARKLDSSSIRFALYFLALRRGDAEAMRRQIEWTVGRPDEYQAPAWQAREAAMSGQLRKAGELFKRAAGMARQKNLKEPAAQIMSMSAAVSALFGDCRETKETTSKAVALARTPASGVWYPALALAFCDETGAAQSLAADYAKLYPGDPLYTGILIPVMRAAIGRERNGSAQAIELLRPTLQYGGGAYGWPEYFRGLAYLREQKAAEAMAEFQTVLDHPGWYYPDPVNPRAHAQIGLARAAALAGDAARSRKAYEEFFALWQNADPDIPLLREAKREYERLR